MSEAFIFAVCVCVCVIDLYVSPQVVDLFMRSTWLVWSYGRVLDELLFQSNSVVGVEERKTATNADIKCGASRREYVVYDV